MDEPSTIHGRSDSDDPADQLNTLTFLGLGSPPHSKFVLPATFISPSSVKRMSVKKASFPSPLPPFGMSGIHNQYHSPPPGFIRPLQTTQNVSRGLDAQSPPGLSRENVFQHPFAPSNIPPRRDPLFSRLSKYQQSMVSPIWNDVGLARDWIPGSK